MKLYQLVVLQEVYDMNEKIEIYFSKLFSNVILKNKIVSTILYTISQQIKEFDEKIKLTINEDI